MASAAAEPTRAAFRARTTWALATVAAIVALDQLTKVWAVATLSDGPVRLVGDVVELRLTRNPGSAFGRFQGMTPILATAAVIVSVLLVRAVHRATDRVIVVGLVLVLGGALGNLADRMFRSPGVLRGHVVDFVSVGSFPVFNLADACITVGAVLLVLRSLRTPH